MGHHIAPNREAVRQTRTSTATRVRRRRAYASNLLGIIVPALLAGGATAVLYRDADFKQGAELDLVTRAEMIRNADVSAKL